MSISSCLISVISRDYIANIESNMGAEQRARATYEHLMELTNDPDVLAPLAFLREREIVHYQRFGEALRIVQDHLDSKNFYAINPEFDIPEKIKERTYDLKSRGQGRMIQVSIPAAVPLKEFEYNEEEIINPVADTVATVTFQGADVAL